MLFCLYNIIFDFQLSRKKTLVLSDGNNAHYFYLALFSLLMSKFFCHMYNNLYFNIRQSLWKKYEFHRTI